jgi:endonuclease/exonuclease/phosphatase family metal-dependent hydrolase
MKLTTLNLQGFDEWEERLPHIISFVKKEQPDVLFFQEAVYLPELSPFNQAQLLNQHVQYLYELSTISRLQVGVHYPTYREGLVVLSKHPIVRSDTIILKQAEGDEHNRIVQLIDVSIDGNIIKCAHVHFSITDVVDYATAHLKETIDIIRSRGESRIIIGDFNLSFLEDSEAYWGQDYKASTEVPYLSYPTMDKRVDYALIPKDYSFDAITVSDDSLSDHRALTVEITVS